MTENSKKLNDDNLEKFNKIILTLKDSLKISPKNYNLHISLGNEYLKLRRFELAFQSYLSAYDLEPKNADISVCIGCFHREVGNYNDAASALLNAIKLDKNCVKAYVDLSDVYFNLGQHKDGLEYLYKVDGVIQFDIENGLSVSKGNI
ncbi:tetratricopeptide repeat protein [Methylophilaceae bacterium]|jgi:tetratricopeptide (TPR) repeat protein|nr:tetratricopeptide repeat protein [Methylophilaceae bacterium]